MPSNEDIARAAAAYKRDSRKEFDRAVAALVALAFEYRRLGADFLWDADPGLDARANEICRDLSDSLARKAKEEARRICADALGDGFDEAWEETQEAASEEDADGLTPPLLERLDRQGSLLKELLEVWVALAFVYGLTEGVLLVEISRYLATPFLSRYWRDLPRDILAWGRGYPKDIAGQLEVLGQNAIIATARRSEWKEAKDAGATYYIRRRGSTYDCPDCDDLCGYPIPIEVPFEFVHSRCMCTAEYHYEPMP